MCCHGSVDLKRSLCLQDGYVDEVVCDWSITILRERGIPSKSDGT